MQGHAISVIVFCCSCWLSVTDALSSLTLLELLKRDCRKSDISSFHFVVVIQRFEYRVCAFMDSPRGVVRSATSAVAGVGTSPEFVRQRTSNLADQLLESQQPANPDIPPALPSFPAEASATPLAGFRDLAQSLQQLILVQQQQIAHNQSLFETRQLANSVPVAAPSLNAAPSMNASTEAAGPTMDVGEEANKFMSAAKPAKQLSGI